MPLTDNINKALIQETKDLCLRTENIPPQCPYIHGEEGMVIEWSRKPPRWRMNLQVY